MSDGQVPGNSSIQARIAAAPISWGVCEVPGWGYQLAPDQVLTEMSSLGFSATEFGPDGFLADEPAGQGRPAGVVRHAGGRRLPPGPAPRQRPRPDARGGRVHRRVSRERRRRRRAGGVHRSRRLRRAPGPRRRPVATHARQPRPDRRRTPRSAASSPACTRTSARWSRPPRRSSGSMAGSARRSLRRHRPPRWSAVPTRSRSPRRTPTGSGTCTSRTSTLDQAKQVIAGDVAFGHAVKNGMFRPLGEGDVDIVAMVTHARGAPATTAGTSSSRT